MSDLPQGTAAVDAMMIVCHQLRDVEAALVHETVPKLNRLCLRALSALPIEARAEFHTEHTRWMQHLDRYASTPKDRHDCLDKITANAAAILVAIKTS